MNRPFRIAVSALIAVLSVTVMVASMASAQIAPCPSPPLAGDHPPMSPLSARLSIKPVVDGHRVGMSGFLRASSVAEAHRLYFGGWRAEYTLWGEDPGADDRLYGPQSRGFGYMVQGDRCEGRVYFSGSRVIRSAGTTLDEDSGSPGGNGSLAGRDEIYAEVRFGPHYRAETNRVYGLF